MTIIAYPRTRRWPTGIQGAPLRRVPDTLEDFFRERGWECMSKQKTGVGLLLGLTRRRENSLVYVELMLTDSMVSRWGIGGPGSIVKGLLDELDAALAPDERQSEPTERAEPASCVAAPKPQHPYLQEFG